MGTIGRQPSGPGGGACGRAKLGGGTHAWPDLATEGGGEEGGRHKRSRVLTDLHHDRSALVKP